MHSVMNTLYAYKAVKPADQKKDVFDVYQSLSKKENKGLRN